MTTEEKENAAVQNLLFEDGTPTEQNPTETETKPTETKPAETPTEAPKKKDARGRKKGSTKEVLEAKKTGGLTDILNDYKETIQQPAANVQEAQKQAEQQKDFAELEEMKKLVNGYMLLIIMDVLIGGAFLKLYGFFDKEARRIKSADVHLTKQQFDKLEPIADKVAILVVGKVSPIALFFLASGAMYYSNIVAAKVALPKQPINNPKK